MTASRLWFSPVVFLLVTGLTLPGCGGGGAQGPGAGKETGTVKGTVKIKGQPAPANTIITFLGGDGVAATGVVDGTGYYSLSFNKASGIPVGNYKVSLAPFNPGDAANADPAMFFDAQGNTKPPVVEKSIVAAKYTNPTTSGITRDVQAGANTIDLDLAE
jgi:hypothetical protein